MILILQLLLILFLQTLDVAADIHFGIQFRIPTFSGINHIFREAQKMRAGELCLLFTFETWRHHHFTVEETLGNQRLDSALNPRQKRGLFLIHYKTMRL